MLIIVHSRGVDVAICSDSLAHIDTKRRGCVPCGREIVQLLTAWA